nr:MaoC family dehydratase [Desulfoferrobacter suflitae]
MKVGAAAQFAKTVSEVDVYLYAGLSDDFNPAHINEAHARKPVFKTRIAHGMPAAGFISAVLGTQLPAPGSIYIRQELNFLAPVHMGDTITARVEVVEVDNGKKRVRMRTTCVNQNSETVLDGEAVVSPPRR